MENRPSQSERQSGVGWNGGEWTYYARGLFVMHGPQIVCSCLTKTGARFGAWRRGRNA